MRRLWLPTPHPHPAALNSGRAYSSRWGPGNSVTSLMLTKTQPPASASTHEIIIEAGRSERHYWHDLWQYRELFRVLAWRDVVVRYKQTVIGVAWAVIRPVLTMI